MSDWFDLGPAGGEDLPGDDLLGDDATDSSRDSSGGVEGQGAADRFESAADDDPLPPVGEPDGAPLFEGDDTLADDVALPAVGTAADLPETGDAGLGDVAWWAEGVTMAAELLEPWPTATGIEPDAFSRSWTPDLDLEPLAGFADAEVLGAAEPPPDPSDR